MNFLKPDAFNTAAIENSNNTVRAIVIEDPNTLGGMIAERNDSVCDRCLDPRQAIAGIVFFMDAPSRVRARLERTDWALCAGCLDSLKQRGAEALSSHHSLSN